MKTSKMKISRFIVIMILAISLLFSYGCQKKASVKETVDKGITQKGLPDKLSNPDIALLVFSEDEKDVLQNVADLYMQKYGGKVTFEVIGNANMAEKLIAKVTSGDSVDIVRVATTNYLLFIINGLIQPIDNYYEATDPIWAEHMNIAKQYIYKNNLYGIPASQTTKYGCNPFLIFFNKTLFENNGLQTPMEYYKKGNWTWGTLRDVAIKLTQDTNNDGNIDQWGYIMALTSAEAFMTSNNADFVSIQEDGKVQTTLRDPRLFEALQFYQDAVYKDKYMQVAGTWLEQFAQGRAAMTLARLGNEKSLENAKFEWDFVPFPTPVMEAKGSVPATTFLYSIGSNSNNPEGAMAFLYMRQKWFNETSGSQLFSSYTDKQIAFYGELVQRARMKKYDQVGITQQIVNTNIFNQLGKGTPVATVAEQSIPLFEEKIQEFLKEK